MEIKLSKAQQRIVEATEPRIVVESCAGSGKTRCLTERIKHLIANGVAATEIVAITFTNAASEEMYERVGQLDGLRISTIHSYCNYLLQSYGVDTRDYLEKEDFDSLFKLVKENQGCIKHVTHLLLDEGQDSTSEQFELLLNIIVPDNWMIFADPRQAIYRFADANPDYIINLMHTDGVKVYHLYENYRCASKILEYAKGIIHLAGIDYDDNSVSVSGQVGTIQDVEYNPDVLAKGIYTYTEKYHQQWKDWFILCRTNDQIDNFCKSLDRYGIPHDSFKRKDLTNSQLNAKMLENTVKVLTIHAAKGLENTNVAVIGARFYSIEEKCVSYVAATRAKELLIWARVGNKKKYYSKGVSNWE